MNIGLLQASYLTRGKLLLLNDMYEELMLEDSTLRGTFDLYVFTSLRSYVFASV